MEYPGSKKCSRIVRFEEGSSIHIEFLGVFELERWGPCWDTVEIRDGEHKNSSLIAYSCDNKPTPMFSSGNTILIKFESSEENNFQGFSLQVNQTKGK